MDESGGRVHKGEGTDFTYTSKQRSGQKKIPKCFLRKEIPAKKRVHRNFKIVFGFQNFDVVPKVRELRY